MAATALLDFNSRPSARGDGRYAEIHGHCRYFNSRPSARGDGANGGIPTALVTISIHAPPRGATNRHEREAAMRTYFNSRPSARGDSNEMRKLQTNLISIHAPPRGATASMHGRLQKRLFQFTPLREGRRTPPFMAVKAIAFQFTPLREGRRRYGKADTPQALFQFTPLREGRQDADYTDSEQEHFNSRPSARGDS